MDPKLDEQIPLTLPKGTLLVLFEFLERSYEVWRGTGEPPQEDTFVLQRPDPGERRALWQLEGAVERTLPEIFSSNYPELLAEWKRQLTLD
jgi:hypothetical protein